MKVVSPVARPREERSTCAPRHATLDGLIVESIELNFKNAAPFMDRIYERLRADFRIREIRRHPKIHFTDMYPPDELDEIGERAQVGHPLHAPLRERDRHERGADEGDATHAAALERDGVVDTPRAA